jgi:hypothetical protein
MQSDFDGFFFFFFACIFHVLRGPVSEDAGTPLLSLLQIFNLSLISMGGLVISRSACRAISARRRTTAHITVVSSALCTGYVVNKTVSCVLMNMILVTII